MSLISSILDELMGRHFESSIPEGVFEEENHYDYLSCLPKSIEDKLWSASTVWPSLSVHASYAIQKYLLRNPSFFINSIDQVDSLESIAWYLFRFNDHKGLQKRLSGAGVARLKSLMDPSLCRIYLPPAYLLWKRFIKKQALNVMNVRELSAMYQDDLDLFVADCYEASIHESLFLNPILSKIGINQLDLDSSCLSLHGAEELDSRLPKKRKKDFRLIQELELVFKVAIEHPCDGFKLRILGAKAIKLFGYQVNYENQIASIFAFVAFNAFSKKFPNHESLPSEQTLNCDVNAINEWFRVTWCSIFPSSGIFYLAVDAITTSYSKLDKQYRSVVIVANWDSASGLTKNAVMSEIALREMGLSTSRLLPLDKKHPLSQSVVDGDNLSIKDHLLLHINADEAPETILRAYSACSGMSIANTSGFFLWETADPPPIHELGCLLVDTILTPTEFVKNCYVNFSVNHSVVNIGKYIPKTIASDDFLRDSFDLDRFKYIFLNVFDAGSGIERKNPLALVETYLKNFQDNGETALIIKCGLPRSSDWGDPFEASAQIINMVKRRRDILLITDFISDQQMQFLIERASAIVSTHRAEGFGYLMAYALLAGKPLICTAYSGLDHQFYEGTATQLINYDLISTPNNKFFQDSNKMQWAEVDKLHLAQSMIEYAKNQVGNFKPNPDCIKYFSAEMYGLRLMSALNAI